MKKDMKKEDLIRACQEKNIFYRSSWNKAELEEALRSGVKFGTLVECVCPRSGLVFQVPIEDKREGLVHPKVRWYLNHNNYDIRYKAIAVISSRKWESWEELESAIAQKLSPPSAVHKFNFKFEGAWVAKITGYHSKYRFEREFLEPIEKGEKRNIYDLNEVGFYEACYKSNAGNETRYYYQVQEDLTVNRLSLEEIEQIFPESAELQNCLRVEEWFPEGKTVEYQGKIYTVVRCDNYYKTEEVWDDYSDDLIRETVTAHTSWLKEVNEAEALAFRQKQAEEKAEQEGRQRIKEIVQQIKKVLDLEVLNWQSPKQADFPQGVNFVLEHGAFSPNEVLILDAEDKHRVWQLTYNGRDGDSWEMNNVAGAWIGRYCEVSAELRITLEKALEVITGQKLERYSEVSAELKTVLDKAFVAKQESELEL